MGLKVLFIALNLFIICKAQSEPRRFPTKVVVEKGQGFVFSFEAGKNQPWIKCHVQIGRGDKLEITDEPKDTIYGKIRKFSTDNCGVRVNNITEISNGFWKFLAQADLSGAKREFSLPVTVLPIRENKCPTAGAYCRWRNPFQPRETLACEKNEPEDPKYSSCIASKIGSMNMMEVHRVPGETVVGTERMGAYTRPIDIDGMTVLKCGPKISFGKLKRCIITQQDSGAVYNIEEGLQHSKYSSRMTNFEAGVCEFEIPISESSAEDEGVWIMEMFYENGNETCAYSLGWKKWLTNTLERIETEQIVNTKKDKVRVECISNAPFPIDTCYLLSLSDIHPEHRFSENRDEMLEGTCGFDLELSVSKSMEDKDWQFSCTFNGPDKNDKHLTQPIKVRYFKNDVVDGKINGTSMECHHIYAKPISSCIFISPTKKTYSIPTDLFRSKEFSYSGPSKGFQNGHCGMTLEVLPEPGQWTCVIDIGDNKPLTTGVGLNVE